MFKKKKNERMTTYSYCLHPKEDICIRLVLQLFDLLGFKQNIALCFFRAQNLDEIKNFQEHFPCRVIRDVTRSDRFCVFVPELQSNTELQAIMNDNDLFDCTDYDYVPLITNLEEFLFSRNSFNKSKNEITCKLTTFAASLWHEGMNLSFDLEQWKIEQIESVLTKWENTFGDMKFEKNIK